MGHPVRSGRFVFMALYAAAALVLIDQTAELVVSIFPLRGADIQWRFASFGLIVGRTTTAIFVDVMVLIAALGLGHRVLLKVWGVFHFVVGAALLGGLVMFSLDATELGRAVGPEAATVFALSAVKAAVVVVVSAGYCVVAAIAALAATKAAPPRSGAVDQFVVVQHQAS